MNYKKQIGIRLRKIRKLKELTLLQVARFAGITKMHLSDIERGNRTASTEVLEKIYLLLGIEKVEIEYEDINYCNYCPLNPIENESKYINIIKDLI
jgi:transcriptional regulator with XRE-family HTH domain